MNKTTIFSFILIALLNFIGFAQGSENFENANLPGSYSDGTFVGDSGLTFTYGHSRNEGDFPIEDEGLMLRRASDSYLEWTLSNGVGNLSFEYRKAFTGGAIRQLEVIINDIQVATTPEFGEGSGQQDDVYTFSQAINQNGEVTIRIKNVGATTGNTQSVIDNISWTAMGNAPTLTITSPADGDELPPLTTPTIAFNVGNFDLSTSATSADGDGYIQYKVDQNAFEDYFSLDPIVLNGLDAGLHEVTLQLVDNNGDELSPEVSKTVSFTITEITEVSSIGALRAGDLGAYYTLTEEVILTYQQNFRRQKYIQDATGAILIDDTGQILTKDYNQYDGITGISGKLQEHNGLKQFVPIIDADEATSTDNSITIVVLSINDYMADPEVYESQVIAFENVNFLDADGTATFATGTNYDISDGVDTAIMRTNFFDADYIGEVIPQGTLPAMVGIASHFNGEGQIFPRDTDDLDGTTLSVEDFETATKINIYPNPATDHFYVNVTNTSQIEVFSIIGKKVIQTQVSNQNTPISIRNLKAGVYIIKITQGGNTTTKKLIVR